MTPSEPDLLERARAGDTDAFIALTGDCRNKIFNLALGLTQNPVDADILCQDAFVKAFENIDRFAGRSSFFTWVYRITVNLAINARQKKRREVSLDHASSDGEPPAEPGRWEPPDAAWEADERQREVRAALSNLKPEFRAAVVLVYLEDKTPREAAADLGCAEATVHWRLFRARRHLKSLFQQWGIRP